jgi:predicted transcriptional regulator of viral defense system
VCKTLVNTEGYAHMIDGPDYQLLYEVAESQSGYFAANQARACGFSWERLSSNVKNGRFMRVRHGIYRLIQYPGSAFEDLVVAWLRTGPESVISHDSALALYDLSDILPTEVHIIVSRTASRRRQGIRQHTHQLDSNEVTSREGLPVTTVLRTLADVASAGLAEEQVRLAIYEAIERGMTSEEALRLYARKRGGRLGNIVKGIEKSGGKH